MATPHQVAAPLLIQNKVDDLFEHQRFTLGIVDALKLIFEAIEAKVSFETKPTAVRLGPLARQRLTGELNAVKINGATK